MLLAAKMFSGSIKDGNLVESWPLLDWAADSACFFISSFSKSCMIAPAASEKLADFRCNLIAERFVEADAEKNRPLGSLGVATGDGKEEVEEEQDEQRLRISNFVSRKLSSASFFTQSSASRIVLAINRKVRFDPKSVISKLPPAVFVNFARLTDMTHLGRGGTGHSPAKTIYCYRKKIILPLSSLSRCLIFTLPFQKNCQGHAIHGTTRFRPVFALYCQQIASLRQARIGSGKLPNEVYPKVTDDLIDKEKRKIAKNRLSFLQKNGLFFCNLLVYSNKLHSVCIFMNYE